MVNVAKFAQEAIKCLNEDPYFNVDLPGGVGPVFEAALEGALGPFGVLFKLKLTDIPEITKLTTPEGVIKLIKKPFDIPKLPRVKFEVSGVSINVGNANIPEFDPNGLIKLLIGLITIPVDLVMELALGFLDGKLPKPPSIKKIIEVAIGAFSVDFDISEEGQIFIFIKCFAEALFGVLKALFGG